MCAERKREFRIRKRRSSPWLLYQFPWFSSMCERRRRSHCTQVSMWGPRRQRTSAPPGVDYFALLLTLVYNHFFAKQLLTDIRSSNSLIRWAKCTFKKNEMGSLVCVVVIWKNVLLPRHRVLLSARLGEDHQVFDPDSHVVVIVHLRWSFKWLYKYPLSTKYAEVFVTRKGV